MLRGNTLVLADDDRVPEITRQRGSHGNHFHATPHLD